MRKKKSRESLAAARKWRRFVDENATLLSKLSLPLFLTEQNERFEYWLMNGTHPDDITVFKADNIPAESRPLLLQLVQAYLEAGFPDPGIVVLRDDEWSAFFKPASTQR